MLQEQDIEKIISNFYTAAIEDILIGYQFQKIDNFSEHVRKIAAFWKHQLYPQLYPPITDIRFRATHLKLHLNFGELGRWIMLFYQHLDQWSKDHGKIDEINRWKNKVEQFKELLVSHPHMFR